MVSISDLQGYLNPTSVAKTDVASDSPNALGQGDFLQIMLAQIRNQDPMNPMDGANFLGQLAQFSTVDGIQSLERSFSELSHSLTSSKALQATSLVGRSVLIESSLASYEGESVRGAVNVPTGATTTTLEVKSSAGELLFSRPIQIQEGGRSSFEWDGTTSTGELAPNGLYEVSVVASEGDQSTALPTSVWANVESVTLGRGGAEPVLNLAGLGVRSLDKVEEIL
jgi:flagellar basal-body rod modification protein FlgD